MRCRPTHVNPFARSGERLTVETAALKAAIDTRGQESARRVAATSGTIAEARRGLQLVRLIDALYAQMLASDEAKLAEWRKSIALVREGGAKGGEVVETEVSATNNEGTPREVRARAA